MQPYVRGLVGSRSIWGERIAFAQCFPSRAEGGRATPCPLPSPQLFEDFSLRIRHVSLHIEKRFPHAG